MKKCMPVQIDSEYFSFSIPLNPFIVEWGKTKEIFISCIARDIMTTYGGAELQHFVCSSSDSLVDSWCKYSIFGGMNNLILRPDQLQFNFENISLTNNEEIGNLITKCFNILLPKLGYKDVNSFSINVSDHVTIKDGSKNEYFEKYDKELMMGEISMEKGMNYKPSVSVIFESENRERILRYSVEPSAISTSDLFVAINIFVFTSNSLIFKEEIDWLNRAVAIATQSVGLKPIPEEGIDNA